MTAPRTATVAERAAEQYREMARVLRRDAYQASAKNHPIEAARLRYLAKMAEHAAEVELAPQENLP